MSPEMKKSYCQSAADLDKEIDTVEGFAESTFEQDVSDFLKDNLKTKNEVMIKKQYGVGTKRIDLAILDKRTRRFLLGIEVDGHRYHAGKGIEKVRSDESRQWFLEAKGYKIYRIPELKWKTKRENIIGEISAILATDFLRS